MAETDCGIDADCLGTIDFSTCQCGPPLTSTDNINCVDLCDGRTCGINQRCDINTGNCVCDDGFNVNPNGGCSLPLNNPGTLCGPGPGGDADCGLNAICTGPQLCLCKFGFSDSGDGINCDGMYYTIYLLSIHLNTYIYII